jgi:hypothetical protein
MTRGARRRPPANHFDARDEWLRDLLETQNLGVRSVLCTLARHGVAFRQREPERAGRWVEVLSPHPLFKGGQFLFDLLEWEDFMLDGEPPILLDPARLILVLDRLARAFGVEIEPRVWAAATGQSQDDLPPLQPGFHLYRDVVLGLLAATLAAAASIRPEPEH